MSFVDACVHGALFHIPPGQKDRLDKAESLGAGYDQRELRVETGDGHVEAWTYIAGQDYVDESLIPYDWYRDLVVAGAESLGLPVGYVDVLRSVVVVKDGDLHRAQAERTFLTYSP